MFPIDCSSVATAIIEWGMSPGCGEKSKLRDDELYWELRGHEGREGLVTRRKMRTLQRDFESLNSLMELNLSKSDIKMKLGCFLRQVVTGN